MANSRFGQACYVSLLCVLLVTLSSLPGFAQDRSVIPAKALATTPVPTGAVLDSARLTQRVIELTNLERISAGLPPLKANASLSQAAQAHSQAMAERDFFDHRDPSTGSESGDRVRATGYLWNLVGENLGLGYPSAEEAVIGWMNSQGHRENILNPDYREIGVGYSQGGAKLDSCQHPPCRHYWTQDFGARSDQYPVVINEETEATTNSQVSLYIYGQDWAQEMRLRNDTEPFGDWESFKAQMSWQLPDKAGLHTVTVELRNKNGDVVSAQDEILLITSSADQPPDLPASTPVPTTSVPTVGASAGTNPVQIERRISPDNLVAGQEVQVTFRIIGNIAVCGEQEVRTPLDIALVIDHSGSMGDSAGIDSSTSKLDAAKRSAIAFLQAVELGTDQVAVISFSDQARLEHGLDIDLAALTATINNLQVAGGTNISDGILAGLEELTGRRHRQDAAAVLILLSDGKSTSAQSAAQQAKAQDVRVVTIGLGPDVDENELRNLASAPTDYYFSPDTSQLETIFLEIARSIRKVPAATNLVFTHRLDVTNFEVIPDSIKPQGQYNFDRIVWRVPMLAEDVIEFSYRARARVVGDFDVDLGDGIVHQRCGLETQTINLASGLAVKVQPDPNATPTPIPTPPQPPLPPGQALMAFVCGDFPWWFALALLLFLILLPLILWKNLGGLRQRWTSRKECPLCCLVINLALLAYSLFLVALMLGAFRPLVCQPKEAIYFWQVTPDGDSAIYYKPIEPYLPVRTFSALNQKASCIACHNTALNSDLMAAVADGSNGPVSLLHLDGTSVSIPAITASYVAVAPGGKQVAYALEGKDIYVLDVESGSTAPLPGASDPGVIETMPAWSPDGQTIAFVRASGEVRGYALAVPCDIYTIPASGGAATLLPGAGGAGFNYYPAYSPDGRWLAFTRHTTGSSTRADPQAEIYLVPAQGGQPQRLAANDLSGGQPLTGVSNSWPTWSPKGDQLAFNTKRNAGQFDIYLTTIDPDGTSGPARPLVGAARLDRFEHLPQWGKPPRVNLLSRLLGLLPWLIPLLLLWLARRRLCLPRQYPHTLALTGEVKPDSGYVGEQVFNVMLTLSGDNKTCDEVRIRKPIDVLLVLDISGSMNEAARAGLGERKLDGAKAAAKAFVQKMDAGQDRIGLIVFDDKAEVVHSLDAIPAVLGKAIDGLACRGGTAIHEGLAAALDEMKTLRRAGVAGAIILLSDGGSEPEPALEQAGKIGDEGIRLITIGFGQDAARDLLQKLATSTRDCHFSASNRQLEDVFLSIAQQIQEPVAATDITLIHRVNGSAFELDRGSIYPAPQRIEGDTIIWHLSELGSVPRHFRYQVIGKQAAERLEIDSSDTVRYKRCGDLLMELPDPHLRLPVTVLERQRIRTDGKRVAPPPEPLPIPERHPIWEPDAVLILGVGTFGRHVLTHLKKNLRDAGSGAIPNHVQFLLIDSAKYLASGKPLSFAGVALDDDEVFVLNENLRPVIEEMRDDPDSHPELRPWLQPESYAGATQMLTLAEGTHGQRPLARAGLVRRVSGKATGGSSDLIPRLTELLKMVNQPPHGVRVILAGSLSEGMGATLADFAYLGRAIAKRDLGREVSIPIEGYLGVEVHSGSNESVTDQEMNALIALRELTWLERNPDFEQSFSYGDPALDQSLPALRQRLIDDVYVFPSGLGIHAPTAWPAIADVITLRLDAAAQKVADKDWYDLRRDDVKKREPEVQQLCFGTAGSFVIRLPAFDLMEAVKVRWTRDVIQFFLMGQRRDQLAFAADFNQDENLPRDPAALINGFFEGFDHGDHLYSLDAPVPGSVRALGHIRQGQSQEALRLPPSAASDVTRYVNTVLHLMLQGVNDKKTLQPRAGKIGYAAEFLVALKLECEGDLNWLIFQSTVAPDLRNTWDQTRSTLLQEVLTALTHIGQIKSFLGQVYGHLEDHARDLALWRVQMNQVPGRLYVWEELVDPTGKLLPQPRDLVDAWYEEACRLAPPESFVSYLSWDVDTSSAIDLRLVRSGPGSVSSTASTANEFVSSLLEFANDRLESLWVNRNLASLSHHAVTQLQARFERDDRFYQRDDIQHTIQKLQQQARSEGERQDSFKAAARVERNVIAVSSPPGDALQALSDAFPSPVVQSNDPTQWDWPRLLLSDRFGWQLVHTLDVLTLADIRRYETILQGMVQDATPRAVFPWEAEAISKRSRFGQTLLHPVVASTLIDETRSNLYGLAFASGWIVPFEGRWHLRASRDEDPIVSWTPTAGWDGAVYGLLHFVYRAKDTEVQQVQERIKTPTVELYEKWQQYRRKEPGMLRMTGDKDDIYSLRLLARHAVGVEVGELLKLLKQQAQ